MKILAVVFTFLTICTCCFAGSRNGYRLVFINESIKESAEDARRFSDYFNSEFPAEAYRCENRFVEFDLVYMRKRPKGITPQLTHGVSVNDRPSIERMRSILQIYRDSEIDNGFDGMVIFQRNADNLQLTALSVVRGTHIKTARERAESQELSSKMMKRLICELMADFGYTYQGK